MAIKEREERILRYLGERRTASVAELSRTLYVSEPTMRRDLLRLAGEGKLYRTYGGAALRQEPGENLPQALRAQEHAEAKAVIGRKCLSLINEGDTVMVDASSTAYALLSLLGNRQSLLVVTNHAKAAGVALGGGVRLFVTGGELARETDAYVGSFTEDFLEHFHADVCFFSVRTLTRDGLLTDNAIAENAVRRKMLARAERRVLMLDSRKVGAPCASVLCDLGAVTHVVSECPLGDLFPTAREKFL